MTASPSTGIPYRYDDLSALYVNCTLKPSPQLSHTQGLIDRSRAVMDAAGVTTDLIRAVDHDIAPGVHPDMTEHGFATDAWPGLYERVMAADILVLAGPIWLRIGRKIGKKNAYMIAVSLMAAECASWLITGPQVTMLGIWIRGAIFGFGSCGSMLMSSSMLPDAMEYDRLRTGLRREGVFASLYAIVEKSGWAIGAAFTGLFLAASGYISTSHGNLVTQPEDVTWALYLCVGVLPALLFSAGLLLISGYKLDPGMLEEERQKAVAKGLI